ncbi:sensor histidine kinase [Cecembia rubra]|uniref:histidine kinase n=1 Tax=Cecembia rubra TaxID=1485585 RepID=A0A2P8E4E4_9BACT|nr:ATP-binding protein [Cecembia rubra]PSL04348.1 histidine kinase/DNA gyrase B/HSP90-like ATPase [Cecembia rubra]
MTLENFIALILLIILRRRLAKSEIPIYWKPWITWGLVASGLIFLLKGSGIFGPEIPKFLSFGLVAAVFYFILKEPDLKNARNLVYAILPLVIISFVGELFETISKDFYDKRSNYFEIAEFLAIVWAISMWYNARKQRKAIEAERKKAEALEREFKISETLKAQLEIQVAERTAEISKQKEELEEALKELKATQSQLIHAEKMASLGELTAGIAHEIQNPLNFVNNFSEVSAELVDEILEARSERREARKEKQEARDKKQEARDKKQEVDPDESEELEDEILEDLKKNLEKIKHHGKRADSIVKGMLQHSRSGTGEKEITDINELVNEFLKLSYHGLRAKDKSFNADFRLDLQPNLPKIAVMPQEISRVILNLINNAFYAVMEKAKLGADGYHPLVTVSTRKNGDNIEIAVKDNGNGIPEHLKAKIFQPFFTTKPTGQGTGLGLSLSYDIVKAHGGNIMVSSQEGLGTEFTIELPQDS